VFAYLGYRALKNTKQPATKVLAMLPDSCDLLFKFDNYPEFSNALKNKSLAWQDLRTLSELRQFDKYIQYFDSLISSVKEFEDLCENNAVYFGVYPGNKYLVTLNLKELAEEKIFSGKTHLISSHAALHLSVSLRDGILVISNNDQLIESLFNSNASKLVNNKDFSSLNNSVDYSGTSVYINHDNLLQNSLCGLTIKPESISLNGIKLKDSLLFTGDPTAEPLNTYDFLEQVPLLCNALEIYAVGNAEKLFSKTTNNDWWTQVNDRALFNAKKQFYELIAGHMINVTLPSKNHALIIPVNDSIKFAELVPFISDSSASQTIYELHSNHLSFVRSSFPQVAINEFHFVTDLKDRIILSVTRTDAEIFVNAARNGSSILQNNFFNLYASKNFDTEFHYLSYCLVSSSAKDDLPFNKFLTDDDLPRLKNISHYSYTNTFKNNFINYRLNLRYFQEDILDEPNVLWTMNADTGIITKPFLFRNHASGATEIAFQARTKELFLQNSTGKIIWKKQLNEEIRSEIFVVDAFKNGKLQMLFNSDHYLHLVDRNGNYVQGYPVKLPAKATNQLSVFDYEKKNDLRLFIACSDNKIYNYNIWGVKHEGFKPHVVAGEVTLPIKYCKVGLSDYLITADRKGRIYAFSRRGDGRIDFKNKLLEDAVNFELQEGNNLANTQLVYYDEKNNIIDKISLTDKKEVYKIATGEPDIVATFADVDKNKINDLVIASKTKTEVYNINGSEIFSIALNIERPGSITFHQLNTSAYISVLDEATHKLTVINTDQHSVKEYPATAEPVICDLFRDGKPYLVLVTGNKIKCYKL
jgi:hypothetical protein